MSDTQLELGSACLQHGPGSNRVYIMTPGQEEPRRVLDTALKLAREQGYGKIFAKLPDDAVDPFLQAGFQKEASIPACFPDGSAMHFLALFPDPERRGDPRQDRIDAILERCRQAHPSTAKRPPPPGMVFRRAGTEDMQALAALYERVFASYPFPIHDPGYLRATLQQDVVYLLAWQEQRLVAACSAECHPQAGYAEMTDFATRPEQRGMGLATHLLGQCEAAVAAAYPLQTWMTIARGLSPGMNLVFRRHNYRYAGTLINNTGIAGTIESMNVWYKHPC